MSSRTAAQEVEDAMFAAALQEEEYAALEYEHSSFHRRGGAARTRGRGRGCSGPNYSSGYHPAAPSRTPPSATSRTPPSAALHPTGSFAGGAPPAHHHRVGAYSHTSRARGDFGRGGSRGRSGDFMVDVDNMSYEQLLELEEKVGAVKVGLPADMLNKLRKIIVRTDPPEGAAPCSICMDAMCKGSEVRCLPCSHTYHSECIGQWLSEHKTCPSVQRRC